MTIIERISYNTNIIVQHLRFLLKNFKTDKNDVSTRELSGEYLNLLLAHGMNLVGGSADLGSNTGAFVPNSKPISVGDFSGNYLNYGVREHAMAAIKSPIQLHRQLGSKIYLAAYDH